MKETNKSRNKSKMAAVIAVLLVCVLAVGGTIAYLTTHSKLTNSFTVGNIGPIDPEKPGPGPDGPEIDKDESKLNGNLYEPHWVADSKLMPGNTVAKDPYVGVGPGSEACDVYVYVTNEMENNQMMYFAMNEGWSAVEADKITVGPKTYYTGGLFKYNVGLDASNVKDKNVWTDKALFDNVLVSKDANIEDFVAKKGATGRTITVQAFLHQSKDAQGAYIGDDVILAAAKKAFGITK